MPMIKFPDEPEQAKRLGKMLIQIIIDIDKSLRNKSEKTPPPEWLNISGYELKSELRIEEEIENVSQEIDTLIEKKEDLQASLLEEKSLKDLLFESGKPLEYAVIKSLKLLGYEAKNYNDGELELDQVITSPEGDRFIGETEGRDNSAINIDKFRQLESNISEDLHREDVNKSAIGILFGNGFRLNEPSKRDEIFSEKCISSAKIKNFILIRTPDLFRVAKYVNENNDKDFAKKCRNTIKSSMGKIVEFPEVL